MTYLEANAAKRGPINLDNDDDPLLDLDRFGVDRHRDTLTRPGKSNHPREPRHRSPQDGK
jgi:hypothetical protein